jgi:hypothetical protein
LVIFAIVAFRDAQQTAIQWGEVGVRVFAALAFGLFGAYAARQAERQEESERHHRRFELELASIDPYLIDFPEEKRQEMKQELAKRMFGQASQAPPTSGSRMSGTQVDVIKLLIELTRDLATKKGP